MPNNTKIEKVNELKAKIEKSKAIVFAEYHGLDVNAINRLRTEIKEAGGELSVSKNTLLKVALDQTKTGSEEVKDILKGPVAAIFSYEDAVAPLKVIAKFVKELELPTVKAGFVEGIFADAAKIKILSDLPSREELIARVVRGMKSPLSGITNVFAGTQRNFVYALSAIAKKRSSEESSN